jgi:ribosomal-protein-alanine N-acetyltransferase
MRKNAEHLRAWSPLPQPGEDPSSLTAISKAVLGQRREWKQGDSFIFFVTTKEPGEPIIGRVALTGIMRRAFQNAYLGYWIDADYQGRGLMTEAVRMAVTFGFHDARLHRVQAAVMPRNAASLRLLEKLGFRREGMSERYLQIAGKWEDHIILAKTAEEAEDTQP